MFGILLVLSFVFVYFSTLNEKSLILLLITSLVILAFLNFEITTFIFISTFFANIYISFATASEFFSLVLILSFIINYKFKLNEFKNPIIVYYFLFILCVIPSFLQYINPSNFLLVLRLFSFAAVFSIISIAIKDYNSIGRLLKLFLFFSLVNGIHVLYQAASTEKRVFGFAGIIYVDYVGIALIIALNYFLYKRKNRLLFLIIFIMLLGSLVLTQTRNAWISSGVLVIAIFSQYMFFTKTNRINKTRKFFSIVILLAALSFVIFQTTSINPAAYERVDDQKEVENSGNDVQINTFITRFLIWHTAWNAFSYNPIIGVGLYNFPYVSEHYYTINPLLYKIFVKGLTPHQSFLQILTETGIIGMSGFLGFLITIFFYIKKNKLYIASDEDAFFSNMVFWLNIYVFVSMMMTDAWLQGHLFMLWSFILGLTITQRSIMMNSKKNLHNANG